MCFTPNVAFKKMLSGGGPALIHRSPLPIACEFRRSPIATGYPQFGPIRTCFFWRLGLFSSPSETPVVIGSPSFQSRIIFAEAEVSASSYVGIECIPVAV
jgi:hypothetical protein